MQRNNNKNSLFDKIWNDLTSLNEDELQTKARISLEYRQPLIELILSVIHDISDNSLSILEVGTGSGFVISYLSKITKCFCVGIDLSEKSVKLAGKAQGLMGGSTNFLVGNAENLPFGDESFSIVFSQGVMEHFPDPTKFISEQIRVLTPNGYLIIDVPQTYNPYTLYKRSRVKKGNWAYGWETNYTYSELVTLGRLYTLKIIDKVGYGFERSHDYGFSEIRYIFNRLEMQRYSKLLRLMGKRFSPYWTSFWNLLQKKIGYLILANIAVVYKKNL